MKSLKEKHLSALEKKNFYQSLVEEKKVNFLNNSKQIGTSLWHVDVNLPIVEAKAKYLDELSLEEKTSMPFFGLSVGAKDLFCIKGMKTTAGSKILENFISPYDSTVTKSCEVLGGLITAKTSMDEFAMGSFTNTSYMGKSVIPNYPEYTPGGSSGGSAASLMDDLFDFTLGSDTGGSVRQPAAFCGLVGYKPSYGAFSRFGMISYASSLDQAGFFTKNVEDLLYIMDNISLDKDILDGTHLGLKREFQNKKPIIGYLPEFLDSYSVNDEIKSVYEEKLNNLKSGFDLIPITFNMLKFASQIYYVIACAEASSNLARYQGVYFGKKLINEENKGDFFDNVAEYRGKYFGLEVQKRIILGSYVLSSENFDAIYKKAIKLRKDLTQELSQILSKVDYLILPTFPKMTPKWSDIEKMTTEEIYMADYMTIGFSLAGLPVVTLPTQKTFDIKSTTGLQVVGAKFKDYQLIKDSLELEKYITK